METVDVTTELIPVQGARLHTERAGRGPALVLVPGGGGDAAMYEEIVPLLAGRFTVITFDRRGNSRSPLDEPGGPIGVLEQAEDVVSILDHCGIGRAFVFGNSSGAIITVELVARYAHRLLGAVAHEPPLVQVLPEDSPERRELRGIARLGREKGVMRAFAAFGAMTLSDPPWIFRSGWGQAVIAAASRLGLVLGAAVRSVTRRGPSSMTRMLGNTDLLIRRELPEFCFAYRPDLTALGGAGVGWCAAVGEARAGRPYQRPALDLPPRLGVPCERFPGGHTAYQQGPWEFASRLVTILDRWSS